MNDSREEDVVDLTSGNSKRRERKLMIKKLENAKKKPCEFCSTLGSYRCPNCSAWYCSSACYNSPKHQECSEAFFKRQVIGELKSIKTDEKEMKRFHDLLKRNSILNEHVTDLHDLLQDEQDEEEEYDEMDKLINTIITRLNISDSQNNKLEQIWDQLTSEERDQFVSLLNKSEKTVIDIANDWTPWWLLDDYKQTCIDYHESEMSVALRKVNSDNQESFTPITDTIAQSLSFPLLNLVAIKTIPPASVNKADPRVSNSILALFISYCHLARLHNGELTVAHRTVSDFCWHNLDLWTQLIGFCPSLISPSIVYLDTTSAVSATLDHLLACSRMHDNASLPGDYLFDLLLPDVTRMIKQDLLLAKMATLLVLSDLLRALSRLLKTNKINLESKKSIQLAIKKIQFYMAWVFRSSELKNVFDDWNKALSETKQILE